jgi:hypothetical protein
MEKEAKFRMVLHPGCIAGFNPPCPGAFFSLYVTGLQWMKQGATSRNVTISKAVRY